MSRFLNLILSWCQLFVNVNPFNPNHLVYTLQHVILNRYWHIFWSTCAPGNWKSFIKKCNEDLLKRIAQISRISIWFLFSILFGPSLSPGKTQGIWIRPFIVLFQRGWCSHFSCQLLFLGNQKTKWMFFSNFSAPFIWFVFWEKKKPYKNCKKFIRWMFHPSQFFKCFLSYCWFSIIIENDQALTAIL